MRQIPSVFLRREPYEPPDGSVFQHRDPDRARADRHKVFAELLASGISPEVAKSLIDEMAAAGDFMDS